MGRETIGSKTHLKLPNVDAVELDVLVSVRVGVEVGLDRLTARSERARQGCLSGMEEGRD